MTFANPEEMVLNPLWRMDPKARLVTSDEAPGGTRTATVDPLDA